MKRIILVFIGILNVFSIYSQQRVVVPILIDSKTESELGKFPIDRKYYAQAIDKIKNMNGKAVILKFFFDLPKDKIVDDLLAESIAKIPTFVQATIQKEKNPNKLDNRFIYINKGNKTKPRITGNNGWIPLGEISKAAYDCGFVDGNTKKPTSLPLLEKYNNDYVKSLLFSVVLFVYPDIEITWGKQISINGKNIPMTNDAEIEVDIPSNSNLEYISFIDLLDNKVEQKQIENKIIYIGYDGNEQNYIVTGFGKMNSHRYYYNCIESTIEKLSK